MYYNGLKCWWNVKCYKWYSIKDGLYGCSNYVGSIRFLFSIETYYDFIPFRQFLILKASNLLGLRYFGLSHYLSNMHLHLAILHCI